MLTIPDCGSIDSVEADCQRHAIEPLNTEHFLASLLAELVIPSIGEFGTVGPAPPRQADCGIEVLGGPAGASYPWRGSRPALYLNGPENRIPQTSLLTITSQIRLAPSSQRNYFVDMLRTLD